MKKIFVSLFSLIMMFGLYLPQVSAASINEKEAVLGKMKKLTNGTNLEMIDASELPDNATMLNFNTIEDFEKFVKEQKKYQVDNHETYDPSRSGGPAAGSANGGKPSDYMAAATGIGHIQWRDWVWWQPAETMNITFNYSYYSSSGYNYFSGVSNVNSDNSGISPTDWQQTNSTKTIIDANRTIEIQIAGYYLFGVAVGGTSVGFKDYESFTKYFYRSDI